LTDNQVQTLLCHPGILARHQRQCRWPGRFALVAGAAHNRAVTVPAAARVPD